MADAVAEPAAPAETPAPSMTADELLRLPTGESLILSVGDTLEGGDLLSGFACPAAEIFN